MQYSIRVPISFDEEDNYFNVEAHGLLRLVEVWPMEDGGVNLVFEAKKPDAYVELHQPYSADEDPPVTRYEAA